MNILIDQNNRRYKITPSGYKVFLCKYYDSNTSKYCEQNVEKQGYCKKHENGIVKIEKPIVKINYNLFRENETNCEIFILNIIENFNEIKSCSRTDRNGDNFDIKYQFNNENFERGLQVKILRQQQNSWQVGDCNNYPENTLLVILNIDKNKFALFYSQDCPNTLFLSFLSNSKYKNNCFTDLKEFKKQLLIYMKKSAEYTIEIKPKKDNNEITSNEIIIENGKRYRMFCGKKTLLCNYQDKKTLKYCENVRRKKSYCKRHKDGKIKPKSTIIKNEDGSTTFSNQELRNKYKFNTTTGDDSEIFILDIIKNFKEIKSCLRIGQTGDKCDIKYQFNDENFERGLQVKTLSQTKEDKYRWAALCGSYPENTLLVFVNKERNKFALIYSQYCSKSINFTFVPNSKTKYKNNIFTDIDEFKKQLLIYMKNSIEYKCSLSITQLKEKNSLIRLEEKCKENNLDFNLSNSYTTIYDCIINNLKIQCKFTSKKYYNQYSCFVCKKSPLINGKSNGIPYSNKDDINFIIIEIGDYEGQFYIIPVKEFIDRKVFSSAKEKGITNVLVPPPNYNNNKSKYFWMLQYLNRYDLLKT